MLKVGSVGFSSSLTGITSCATKTALHLEQCLPSVKPVVVVVASTAGSITSSWPRAAMSVCATVTTLQREQCLPSVFPATVHVASIPSSVTKFLPWVQITPSSVTFPFPVTVSVIIPKE